MSKKVVEVYDYVDSLIPILARMFDKRLRGYNALGYMISKESLQTGSWRIDRMFEPSGVWQFWAILGNARRQGW
jgi:hypothetical protein